MRFWRTGIVIAYDVFVAAAAFVGALILRFDGWPPAEAQGLLIYAIPYALMALVLELYFRIPQAVLRYTSGRDVVQILWMVTLTVFLTIVGIFLLTRLEAYPRSAMIMLWLLHVAAVVGPRLLLRLWHNRKRGPESNQPQRYQAKALLVGAGDAADNFLRELGRQSNQAIEIVGILDDNPRTIGRQLHGLHVFGPIAKLRHVYEKLQLKQTVPELLVLTESSWVRRSDLLQIARELGLKIQQVPDITQLADGETLTNLRPVLIEDLLGRQAHKLDMAPIKAQVKGKRVLVTGAGGSIGSELCRQLLRHEPATLVLVESSEYNLYAIERELTPLAGKTGLKAVLQDVRDEAGLTSVFETHKPELVFHAAAYKHVPLVEFNPIAGLTTNVLGTHSVLSAAVKTKSEQVVIVSTDKAVNPTNIMGATKRAAEVVAHTFKADIPITMVRFGNVLGSSGSVIPVFREQIKRGGPVTVTDKGAMRYFMTIPEAAQLILRAGAFGAEQQQNRQLFMLDMGEPVRIWDVAEQMIKLSGLEPGTDIEIIETGQRPGEKLKEELWYDAEAMQQSDVPGLFSVSANGHSASQFAKLLTKLRTACSKQDVTNAVKVLKQMVPEYTPAKNSPYKEVV